MKIPPRLSQFFTQLASRSVLFVVLCVPALLQALPQAQVPQRPSEWWHQRHDAKLIEAQQGDTDADPSVVLLNINEHFLDEVGGLPRALMPDLLHPNTAGYQVWAAAIEPTLSQLLNDEPVQ